MLYSVGQGQLRDAASGHESISSVETAVFVTACRHDLEVPGHVHVSRLDHTEHLGANLIVYHNRPRANASTAESIHSITRTRHDNTDMWKTEEEGLKQALDLHDFKTLAFGGARRDKEKSRAKERVFSIRTDAHRWDPRNQRPELWRLYNGRIHKGESIRAFPLSNWTELDVWKYIEERETSRSFRSTSPGERPVVERDGCLIMVVDERLSQRSPGDKVISVESCVSARLAAIP